MVEGGGEGVILRKPTSLYVPGRSTFLLKIKVIRIRFGFDVDFDVDFDFDFD